MLYLSPDRTRTVEQLRRIPVPTEPGWSTRGGGGSRWKPVNHGELVDTLFEEVERAGLRCAEHAWGVNDAGTDLFGSVVFERPGGRVLPEGTALSLALRHSNAGRYALTFGFGGRVLVCSNGLLVAEHTVSRKHTTNVRLEEPIREGLERLLEGTERTASFVARLRATRVNKRLADRILVEAARTDVLPWSKLGKVDALWRDNPEPTFRPRTAWSLYNCFTEVLKQTGPARQLGGLQGLGAVFEEKALRRLGR